MCGRYYIEEENAPEEIIRIIDRMQRLSMDGKAVKTAGEIFPNNTVPVIAGNRKGSPDVFAMKWGYHLNSKLIINARSETARNKELFRDGINQRRCLIPANAYYEWEHLPSSVIKYEISLKNHLVFYFAGIYRFERNEPVFCILTKKANEQIQAFHPRMPVVFTGKDSQRWLDINGTNTDELVENSLSQMQLRKV